MNFLTTIKGKLHPLISYTNTHMSKSRLITIGLCVAFVSTTLIGYSVAGTDPNALDNARIEQLKREIEENQAQYSRIMPQKTRNQERCTIASQQEKQLTILNTANNAKRSELTFLESKLHPQPDLSQVPKLAQ